ncbi:methyltransferase domain-containing protein [Alienimonas sp. DA493]|uniref:methyltransferase domain-containing protein n=1 Tax=Alienimonas sp. DA493 TaxID=3373605 RepID=UPI003754868C
MPALAAPEPPPTGPAAASVPTEPAAPTDRRVARFAPVAALIEALHAAAPHRPVAVLDAGGFDTFWKALPPALTAKCRVTLLDPGLKKPPREARDPRFDYATGDLCDLSRWRTGEFDLAFSQGALDHLGLYERQERFAAELRRVARRYAVRTPNLWFPVDPDYRVPLWQFLPTRLRSCLVQRAQIGWIDRATNAADATRWVEETRLVTASELRTLFPDGRLHRERLSGLTKSFLVMGPEKFLP